jgi:hypothetical protein
MRDDFAAGSVFTEAFETGVSFVPHPFISITDPTATQ